MASLRQVSTSYDLDKAVGNEDAARELETILTYKPTRAMFRSFLANKGRAHELAFWEDCESLRTLQSAELIVQAQKVYDTFVSKHAPQHLRLPTSIRVELNSTFESKGIKNIHNHLFDPAMQEIYMCLMELLPDFVNTKEYLSYSSRRSKSSSLLVSLQADDTGSSFGSKGSSQTTLLTDFEELTLFKQILDNTSGIETYKRYMNSQGKQAYVDFLSEVKEFQSCNAGVVMSEGKRIFKTYLEGSAIKIDAPEEMGKLKELFSSVAKMQAVHHHSFDKLVELFTEQLSRTTFESFTKSPEYRDWSQGGIDSSLKELLHSKTGRAAFVSYLSSKGRADNLLFYEACESYKTLSGSALTSEGKKIFENYLRPGAPSLCSLPTELMTQAREFISSKPAFTPQSFDVYQQNIFDQMKDKLRDFLGTTYFKEWCKKASKVKTEKDLPVKFKNLSASWGINPLSSQFSQAHAKVGSSSGSSSPSVARNKKKIKVTGKGLTDVPEKSKDDIANSNVTSLNLSNNKLTSASFPPTIFRNTPTQASLQELDLSNNQLTEFPAVFCTLVNLTCLKLSFNKLTAIPTSLGYLNLLEKLHLDHNVIKSLPVETGTLVNLKELHLENNRLVTLPFELSLCFRLKKLFVFENPLGDIPARCITEGRNGIMNYLRVAYKKAQKEANKGETLNKEDDTTAGELMQILKDKDGNRLFHDFLKAEIAEENLIFWDAVEHYRYTTGLMEKNKEYVVKEAKKMYAMYVDENSEKCINVPSKFRAEIDENLANPTSALFDGAQRSVFNTMRADSYTRFKKSKFFTELMSLKENQTVWDKINKEKGLI
eukprot:CAMPEP_0177633870 /NCGR_PEP_ID=MMETSP0447-20121125/3068_1 /TAXON_ID=0 /ORGANISM="Stygamoeba regulata, Strain BSH-02190019" /LENGTH=825 /DNA_ID=CAMNT_0019135559 /DNA_START=55 /DNA_END=2532 /DNA_ORIENTATION=+